MSFVTGAYIVSGQPHVLLTPEKSPAWKELRAGYEALRREIQESGAQRIVYLSTQWLSVLGWMFQTDPSPEWVHVDANWHELGTMRYKMNVDAEFGKAYAAQAKKAGYFTKLINYRGFPVDTGTIVAQQLLNPDNKLSAAMVSCNMYADRAECEDLGRAALRAIEASGIPTAIVLVSSLSSRYFTEDIDPAKDRVSSAKDDEWNRKIVEILGEGRLQDVAEVARDFAREANGDMGFKGIWWLSAATGETNDFQGKVYAYAPVWGSGQTVVGLKPTKPVKVKAPVAPQSASTGTDSEIIDSKAAAEPLGVYPHARREGDLLFLSGMGPRKRGSKEIPGVTLDKNGNITSYDLAVQTHSVIDNVKFILEEAGSSLADIVDVQVYLADIKKDFAQFNKIYAEYFKDIRPTRTTIGVTGLPTPIAVELKVVARLKGS